MQINSNLAVGPPWQDRVIRPAALGLLIAAPFILILTEIRIGFALPVLILTLFTVVLGIALSTKVRWQTLAAIVSGGITLLAVLAIPVLGVRFGPLFAAALGVTIAATFLGWKAAIPGISIVFAATLFIGYSVSRQWIGHPAPMNYGAMPIWIQAALTFAVTTGLLSAVVRGIVRSLERSLHESRVRLLRLQEEQAQREHVEAEHQATEMSLRALLNATTEVAFLMDRDGLSLAFNDALPLSMGLSAYQIRGVSILDLLPPELAEARKSRLQEVFNTGKPVRFEDYGFGAWWDNSAFPVFDELGNVVRIAVFARDITERKRLEEQLIQSQKMEAIGRLAGGIAHDFNNLLTVIMGHADLAKQEATEGSRTSELLEPVLRAGARASDLTRQLLAFARKQTVSPRIVNIERVFRNLRDLLRSLIGEDIELVIEVASDTWRIKVDPGQFDQVLVNLVVNSRDAMPHGGKLTIGAKNVTLTPTDCSGSPGMPRGDYVSIMVTDTGHGMSLETQQKIFEPFFTTKEIGKGTGLGLSTCHGIISQAGGYITVRSDVGHGAAFEIFLPKTEGIEAPVELAAFRPPGGRETIMLVEDEITVRSIASQSLRDAGYDVLEASSGSEALITIQGRTVPIDLLVTDVVMPQMSGRELVRRCEEMSRHMRVLYISGYAEKQIVNQIQEEGSDFLSKPFTPSSLTAKVREILDAIPKRAKRQFSS